MDSLPTTLRSEGMEFYGNDREGDRETKNGSEGNEKALEILDEQIFYKQGCFEKGRRWIKGCHPELGVLVHGWSGWETVQDFDRIRPMHTFEVHEK